VGATIRDDGATDIAGSPCRWGSLLAPEGAKVCRYRAAVVGWTGNKHQVRVLREHIHQRPTRLLQNQGNGPAAKTLLQVRAHTSTASGVLSNSPASDCRLPAGAANSARQARIVTKYDRCRRPNQFPSSFAPYLDLRVSAVKNTFGLRRSLVRVYPQPCGGPRSGGCGFWDCPD
jgi:hypothetical protein